MTDFARISCLLDLNVPADYVSCFSIATNQTIWSIVMFSILIIVVGGWSLARSIEEGMMVGGFLMSLMGVAMWTLQMINLKVVMFPVFIMVAGIFLTIITRGSKD